MSSHKLKQQPPMPKPAVPQKAGEVQSVARQSMQTAIIQRSGPLPDPQELAAFGQISPNFPERIMRMAELEQQHRFEIQKHEQVRANYTATANTRCVFLGQFIALLVVIIVMVATVLCAIHKQAWPATILGGGTLGTIICAIIYGGRIKRQQ